MCGIAGVLAPDGVDEDALVQMNECQRHRGPDDADVFVDDPVGLAHRRLAIIDPEGGHQPMRNDEGTVAVVFNGEIYNYRALRERLRDVGHRFATDSDTEVLVHGYEEHGLDVVRELDGMFAFGVYDAEQERLVLARDRMGIKPLVLASDGGSVAFASEVSALLESQVEHGGLDRGALSQYFALGFVPAPLTAFRNVEKLRPGTLAVVDADGIERQRYYEPTVERRDPGLDAAAVHLRDLVERAVERRLMSDVPLGAFLSGGIDSSVVVGAMANASADPVRTFTVGFDEDRFDESWAAREVAEYHGTDQHEYTVAPSDVRDLVPEVVDRLGEPFADPSLVPTAVVARETSREVTVALSGDGADELFAGYEKYRGEHLARHYRKVPSTVRSRIVEPVVTSIPTDRTTRTGEVARKARKFLRGGESDPVARHFAWLQQPDPSAEDAVPDDGLAAARKDLTDEHERVAAWYDADDFERMLAVDIRYGLPNQMLKKVDRAGMQSSLEVRVPFLDREVVEYALSLPRSHKITNTARKRVLERAFADLLPEAIRDRGKQGFDMPIGDWLKGPMAAEFRDALFSDPTDVLDTAAVRDVYDAHCAGRGDHAKFLWAVYVYARWARRLTDEGVIEP